MDLELIRSKRYIDLSDLLTDLSNDQKSFTSDGDCTDSVFSAIRSIYIIFH